MYGYGPVAGLQELIEDCETTANDVPHLWVFDGGAEGIDGLLDWLFLHFIYQSKSNQIIYYWQHIYFMNKTNNFRTHSTRPNSALQAEHSLPSIHSRSPTIFTIIPPRIFRFKDSIFLRQYIIMQDKEIQVKKLQKDSAFFEPSRFKNFSKDVESFAIPIQPEYIHELYLKCFGYGYFEDENATLQTDMKNNFLGYLADALLECTSLKILKIEYFGFSIEDRSLLKIVSLIENLINEHNRDIEIMWFHTRNLRDCEIKMMSEMFSLIDFLIARGKILEISLEISSWQFITGPLSNEEFFNELNNFTNNIMLMGDHNIRRLRLDFSSFYMNELQAYNLLKETVPQKTVIEAVENKRFDQRYTEKKHTFREDRLSEHREEIRRFLHLINDKYAIEHPIPGKNTFISRQPQYQKRKKQYIFKLMEQRVDKKMLLKIFNEDVSMSEEHKNTLKRIRNQINVEMIEQAQRIEEDQTLVEQVNQIERRIAEKFIKFPFDFVMLLRVERLHEQIKEFVTALLEKLDKLEQFQLDMINWNGICKMGDLKKKLGVQFAQGGLKPLLNKGNKIGQKKIVEQQEKHNLKCKFIM